MGFVTIWEASRDITGSEQQNLNYLIFSIIPKPKASQDSQHSVDFLQLFEVLNNSAKFEGF